MAEIKPFRGYRFNPAVAGDIAKLIAPPYDVIDDSLREILFSLSPYNTARVTRADRMAPPDGVPYESAAKTWTEWHEKQVVTREPAPAVYVYEQFFDVHGRKFSRTGLVALVRLQKLGEGVVPHENTLAGPRADRLELARATHAQFGHVFGLYPDAEGQVDKILEGVKSARPLINTADREYHFHRLWAVTDPATIEAIHSSLRERELLIADGHHRYETALAFAAENPNWEAAQYRMMTLVNMANPGLVILPIHRLIKNVAGFDPKKFLSALRADFEIRPYPGDSPAVRNAVFEVMRQRQAAGGHAFGLVLKDKNHYVLTLRSEDSMKSLPGCSETSRKLDVSILHYLILEKPLGITAEKLKAQTNIEYVHDFEHSLKQATESVTAGQAQALLLLNPTRVEEVQAVAHQRERMPQKSTFFYPKVYSGLVFYDLENP